MPKKKKARDYRQEYLDFHGKPEQRKARSNRVLARRKLMKEGLVKKGDGMDVDHKNGRPMDNRRSNLQVLPKSKNRAKH